MLMNEILMHRNKNISLFQQTKELTLYSLVGCASKKMRGITINYDDIHKSLETVIFFDAELSEEEEEAMQIANSEVIAGIYKEVTGDFILTLTVVPYFESILEKCGNWGWIYLRHEY